MRRLEALEGLRGYAAFLVFLVHACGLAIVRLYGFDPDHASIFEAPGKSAALMFLFRSHYGVDLFFVLSGLLMADIAARRWPGTRVFLARRAMRIYPAYLASLAIALAAGIWIFKWSVERSEVAANLAFLHGFFVLGLRTLNPATWSLSYEAAFYALVPLIALAWRRREAGAPRALWPWMLALALAAIVIGAALVPVDKFIYLAYFALFIPGIAIGFLDPEARIRVARLLPWWLVVLAWAAFTLAVKLGALANTNPAYFVASAAACGAVVIKCCDPQSFVARVFSTRAALALGRISYSFFLVHYMAVQIVGHMLPQGDTALARAAYALSLLGIGFVVSAIAAWALFQLAERFYFERAR